MPHIAAVGGIRRSTVISDLTRLFIKTGDKPVSSGLHGPVYIQDQTRPHSRAGQETKQGVEQTAQLQTETRKQKSQHVEKKLQKETAEKEEQTRKEEKERKRHQEIKEREESRKVEERKVLLDNLCRYITCK